MISAKHEGMYREELVNTGDVSNEWSGILGIEWENVNSCGEERGEAMKELSILSYPSILKDEGLLLGDWYKQIKSMINLFIIRIRRETDKQSHTER